MMADAKGTSISAVTDLFNSLEQLQSQIKTRGEVELEEACTKVGHQVEVITESLAYRMQLYNSVKSDVLFMSDAFWRTIQVLVPLKKKLADLKQYCKEMKLADAGIDPRPIELPTVIQEGSGMKHATSYDDFKKQKLQQASTISSSGTTTPVPPSFGIRKARSHPDVNMHNMQKELESLRVDSKRLKDSEKKLLKETLVLNRKCKILTEARDRAEDRLKIEQTQRDSIEKLRQRNRELEIQVQELKHRQVIKDKEKEEEPIA